MIFHKELISAYLNSSLTHAAAVQLAQIYFLEAVAEFFQHERCTDLEFDLHGSGKDVEGFRCLMFDLLVLDVGDSSLCADHHDISKLFRFDGIQLVAENIFDDMVIHIVETSAAVE